MSVGKTVDVLKCAIFGGKIIDGVTGRQVLVILGESTFFHINGESHVGHFSVNLGNSVIFDPIPGFHAVSMNIYPLPEGVRFPIP